ncbi:uncharacterized protein LOC118699073 isoform X2 [Molothrus ater]|uniref:uncharacterized protein LOC118699073 isoform X2 n=1 Tax=Molothrus ater TaxID=84834 RepID=UPI0023E8E7D3|nr:uncharacterized protein LOC118699073 isoform X2 [Molothrus ater]
MLSRVSAVGSPGPGPRPRRAVCHRPPGHGAAICPERGNGSTQPFTSPAHRLTESIRQDRPSASPPPPLPSSSCFCQASSRLYAVPRLADECTNRTALLAPIPTLPEHQSP